MSTDELPLRSTTPDREPTADRDGLEADRDSETAPESAGPEAGTVANTDATDPADAEDPASTPADPTAESTDQPPDHGRVVSEPTGDEPTIEELREELNEQFESIKIVSPGQYELNLMELYNREEYIISLQEDGRYVIEVPDSWRDGDD